MNVMIEADPKKMAVLLSAMEDLRETVEVYEENHGAIDVARTPMEMLFMDVSIAVKAFDRVFPTK